MTGQVKINIEDSEKDALQAARLLKAIEEMQDIGLDVILYSDIKVHGKAFIEVPPILKQLESLI